MPTRTSWKSSDGPASGGTANVLWGGRFETGPDEIISRLRLGIEPLEAYYHFPRHLVAEGDLVITEHMEQWRFHTGEVVDHPFTSVMEVHDGHITRWHDYSHLGNLLDQAPEWWLTHIADGWRDPAWGPSRSCSPVHR